MRHTLIVFFILSTYTALHSQSNTDIIHYYGEYSGTLYLDFPDKTTDSLNLTFRFSPTENTNEFTYKFIFNSPKYGSTEKDYLLKLNEKYTDNNHFTLDEQNGILIDVVYIKNSLYSQYKVLKGIYSTRLTFNDHGVYYEIICGKMEGGENSISEPNKAGEKYEVSSYLPFTVQQGFLHKLEKNKD